MEWGGFWSSHLPRTYADEQLDNESVNPGQAVPIYCLEHVLSLIPAWPTMKFQCRP
jgi:hypothetical protein